VTAEKKKAALKYLVFNINQRGLVTPGPLFNSETCPFEARRPQGGASRKGRYAYIALLISTCKAGSRDVLPVKAKLKIKILVELNK
jgi:hypothetical protein